MLLCWRLTAYPVEGLLHMVDRTEKQGTINAKNPELWALRQIRITGESMFMQARNRGTGDDAWFGHSLKIEYQRQEYTCENGEFQLQEQRTEKSYAEHCGLTFR
jgi:hypothetical protein